MGTGVVVLHDSALAHDLQCRQNEGLQTVISVDVEKGSARRSSLKGRKRAIVDQTNIRTVSNATLGKLLRDGVKRICPYGLF